MSGFRSLSSSMRRRPGLESLRFGFTLLELVLVTAIILTLVALSTPFFRRTYEDLKLTSSAKTIAYTANFLRERAVFERRDYRLIIDVDNRLCRIYAEDEEDNTFRPLKERWGRSFKIPDGIEVKADRDTSDFSPDGNTDFAAVYLTNKENKTVLVSLEPGTGSIKVYDYIEE